MPPRGEDAGLGTGGPGEGEERGGTPRERTGAGRPSHGEEARRGHGYGTGWLDELWAVLRVECGVTRAELDEMTPQEVAALQEAMGRREERRARRDANLYALMCNLARRDKKQRVFTAEDFFRPAAEVEREGSPEAREALEAYWEMVARGRERRG